jgi:hypothetical protein
MRHRGAQPERHGDSKKVTGCVVALSFWRFPWVYRIPKKAIVETIP